jgi:hypothetical protein
MQPTTVNYTPVITREAFMQLDVYARRVLICKDVIARINAKLIEPIHNIFAHKKYVTQDIVNTQLCEVCAKGAIACSWLGNLNKYNSLSAFDDQWMSWRSDRHNKDINGILDIAETFSLDLWHAIECAYEGRRYDWQDSELLLLNAGKITMAFQSIQDEGRISLDWGGSAASGTNRLIAIMQNIIDNNGYLVIGDLKIG